MRLICAAAGAALVACNLSGFAETRVSCGQELNAALASRTILSIDSRPAGLSIVGTDADKIHVTCTADSATRAQNVRFQFSGNAGRAKLTITSGSPHHGDLEVRIEVPRRTNLFIRMGAGQVTVDDVKGDKDIALYAGQIDISSGHEWNYRHVDASVDIGEVNARAYNTEKGGFFRSFTKNDPNGEYSLRAHVMTGQIDLFGKQKPTTAANTSD